METTCADCPFSDFCPLKTRVKRRCLAGRNPLKAYMAAWGGLVLASLFLS